ncbi:very short patch repair endonuclease [Nonomuraea sp. NPDC049141]|uniref:very short patch repair endonuclease n=1 Tax=Nonomuraea sp. NPDC049141 TaxID=3155500 RepID=UPI003402639B
MGEVDEPTRALNLAAAWKIAMSQGLVLPHDALGDKSWASSQAVRASMRGNRRKDTKPEVALRKAVHGLGLRYRVDAEPIKGFRRRADMVFTVTKVAVFSDGCFWHGCPDHYRASRRNDQYWNDKFASNQARDRDTDRVLTDAGWLVIRVWEHESPHEAAERIAEAVTRRRDT